jgi:hypothetical protein
VSQCFLDVFYLCKSLWSFVLGIFLTLVYAILQTEAPLTVSGLLNSLGLEKYGALFQAEEVIFYYVFHFNLLTCFWIILFRIFRFFFHVDSSVSAIDLIPGVRSAHGDALRSYICCIAQRYELMLLKGL